MGAGGSRVLRRRVVLGSHFIHVKFQPARSSFTTTISAGVHLDVSPLPSRSRPHCRSRAAAATPSRDVQEETEQHPRQGEGVG